MAVKETPVLARLFYVLCVCGEILTSTFVTSDGDHGRQLDRLMTDLHTAEDRQPQPLTHCNHHDMISGQEGKPQIGYNLMTVHMVMTPGETSLLDSQGQGHKPYLSCSPQSDLDPYTTDKMSNFQDNVNVYRMVQTERHGFKHLHPDFNSQCSENHLTDIGFKQVIAIGEHLYTSYFNESYHRDFQPRSSQIHVESIPDHQFYHSALGLLHGILPEKEFVRARVHKSPENFCDTTQSHLTSCHCDYLNELKPFISQALTEGKFMFKNSIPDIDILRQTFGAYTEYGMSALQLLRLFRQARCNGLSSLCDKYGQCYNVTSDNESTLQDIATKSRHRLFSDQKFRQFSEVSSYPFLQRLSHDLSSRSDWFRVYVGTEGFLAMLKTSLSIYHDTPLPLASRFVFEFYQKAENQLDAGHLFFRVLLNGEDLTGQVDGCHGSLENGLCPAGVFRKLVSALQQQYAQKCSTQRL